MDFAAGWICRAASRRRAFMAVIHHRIVGVVAMLCIMGTIQAFASGNGCGSLGSDSLLGLENKTCLLCKATTVPSATSSADLSSTFLPQVLNVLLVCLQGDILFTFEHVQPYP